MTNNIKRGMSLIFTLILAISALSLTSCGGGIDFEVKIVHTNDVHARVEADDEVIGAERLGTIIDEHHVGADIGLALDSGDLFHGQSIATLVKGESIAEIVNALGYDAMSPGNHDWNYTKERLLELEAIAGLEVLAGNVTYDDGTKFFEGDYIIREVTKDNATLKVGIMGMIDPAVYTSTAPLNVVGIRFDDMEEYANSVSTELRETHDCDIVIALIHGGTPSEIAEKVDGVDLWLGGHDHVDIFEKVKTPDGTTSYVVEDASILEQVGLLTLNVKLNADGSFKSLKVKRDKVTYEDAEDYAPKASVSEVLNGILGETSEILNQVVGNNPIDLDGERDHVRTSQTNLGNVITAAYIKETGAQIAFVNGGGIRASLAKGDVTYGDIISVDPFGNYLVTKSISGEALRETMEMSLDFRSQTIAAYEIYAETGEFLDPECSGTALHFSGMTMECDMDAEYGKRVLSITVDGKPLVDSELYTIAVSNYVADSSDYTHIAEAERTGEYCACEEALIKFFAGDADEIVEAAGAENIILK